MEEFTLVGYEMTWTVGYFMFQADVWDNHGIIAQRTGKVGAVGYAARKAAMWRDVAASSKREFRVIKDIT